MGIQVRFGGTAMIEKTLFRHGVILESSVIIKTDVVNIDPLRLFRQDIRSKSKYDSIESANPRAIDENPLAFRRPRFKV